MVEFKRKLYKRGSSFETTIPMPMMFDLDLENKKHNVCFKYDREAKKWYVEFEETEDKKKKSKKKGGGKK